MATIEEIQAQILAEKNNKPELAGLNSSSATSEFALWAYIIAATHYTQQNLWVQFQKEIEARIKANIGGSANWYVTVSKKFQLGDVVEQLPDNEPYSTIDTAKQIVTFASCREALGKITLKVAKGTPANTEPLTNAELLQFKGYMGKMKYAGTILTVLSLPADVLTMQVSISYDPQYEIGDLTTRLKTAIDNFLFGLPFDGVLYKNALVQAISTVQGVINLNQDDGIFYATQGGVTSVVGSMYQSQAGYVRYNEGLSNINFIAAV